MTIVGQRTLFLRCEKVIVDRNDVPERCIDRIEFGLLAGIGKAIRQHALRNNTRPGEQNIARVFKMPGRDAKAANRDKRVAAPIAEPGIAGDEGLSFAALDEICVGGAFERTGEIFPASLLGRPNLGMTRFDGFDVGARVSFSREQEHRRFVRKRKFEYARRREIFRRVESARLFFRVEKISIPGGLVPVTAVRMRHDSRNAGVRSKGHAFAILISYEFERAILVLRRMKIATGEAKQDAKL